MFTSLDVFLITINVKPAVTMLILNHVSPTFSHSNIAQLGTTLVNWLTKEDLRLKKFLTLRTILDFRMKEFFVHFRQRQLLHFFERRNSFKVSFASMSGRERDSESDYIFRLGCRIVCHHKTAFGWKISKNDQLFPQIFTSGIVHIQLIQYCLIREENIPVSLT